MQFPQVDSYGVKTEYAAEIPVDAQAGVIADSQDVGAACAQNMQELGGATGQTGQVNVTEQPTLIKVRNDCRRAIKVTNLGATDVWIGFSPSVSPISGDLLLGVKGSFIVMPVTLDVYAGCATGSSQMVSFLEISQ